MRPIPTPIRSEIHATVALAWPLVVAELGWILMGIVDTVMVGPLGPAAIGAVGTGSGLFFLVTVLGFGTFYALDTFVAQSFGAGDIAECHRWLFAGFQLAAVLSVVLVGVGLAGVAWLDRTGMRPEILAILQPYTRRLLISAAPLFFYAVCRRYLQSMNIVRPITIVVVAANIVNVAGNWVFVYGHLGVPRMGAVGSAYATLSARMVMAALFWAIILQRERRNPSGLHDVPFRWDAARMQRLVRLGMPAAAQLVLEVGVFMIAAVLAGRISALALAANQVVLNLASFFFMIPLGVSAAAAVRVGHAVGRGDGAGVRRAGWVALGVTAANAAVVSAAIGLAPQFFVRLFSQDAGVVAVGVRVLLIYAVAHPFDAWQVVASGALRGVGDTRSPMLANLGYHWLIGLPLAAVLCFWRGWGVFGLWLGLSVSLCLVAATLIAVWARKSGARAVEMPRVDPC